MNVIKKIDRCIATISKIMCYCSALVTLFLMVLIVCDASGRFLFNMPINGTTVLTRNLLVATIFLAIPQVTLDNEHLRSEMVVEKSGPKVRKVLNIIASVIGIAIVLGYTTSFIKPMLVVISSNEMDVEGMAYIPLIPFYIFCFAGCLFSLYGVVRNFILNITRSDEAKKHEMTAEEVSFKI